MYIRKLLINFIKVKNALFIIASVFFLAISISDLISLCTTYWGDWETIKTAKSTPGSINMIVLSIFLLIVACISKKMVRGAYFYSNYFEGDLYGYIQYGDLAQITGKKIFIIKSEIFLYHILYMKKFKSVTINGVKIIELYSKKSTCECKNCGAIIEKSAYFAGVCPYCKSSDVFAKVLTDNHFYSITNDFNVKAKKSRYYYLSKNINVKKNLAVIALALGTIIFIISMIACISQTADYNNKNYLTQVLMSGKSYSSFELIKRDILGTIIVFLSILVAMIPLIVTMIIQLICIYNSYIFAGIFARCDTPFIDINQLPVLMKKKKRIKSIRKAICRHYLTNCSFERQENRLAITLSRKITKDMCPTCGAPIVGAVDENYVCPYCGHTIMNVIGIK